MTSNIFDKRWLVKLRIFKYKMCFSFKQILKNKQQLLHVLCWRQLMLRATNFLFTQALQAQSTRSCSIFKNVQPLCHITNMPLEYVPASPVTCYKPTVKLNKFLWSNGHGSVSCSVPELNWNGFATRKVGYGSLSPSVSWWFGKPKLLTPVFLGTFLLCWMKILKCCQ